MGEKQYRPGPKLWQKLKPIARQMRAEPTEAEQVLWNYLRNRQVDGFRFRRQHAIDRFVVDFFCKEAALIIEVDGPIHDCQKEEDGARDDQIQQYGFRILRFSNEQVLCDLEKVLAVIGAALKT